MTDDELANACPQIGKTLLERNRKAPDGLLMNTCSGLLKYITALEPKQHFIINILKHVEGTEGGERKGGGRDKKGGGRRKKGFRREGRKQKEKEKTYRARTPANTQSLIGMVVSMVLCKLPREESNVNRHAYTARKYHRGQIPGKEPPANNAC